MHILVTGADGFIGSHLVEMLLDAGYEVKALSYYNSWNYWGWLENLYHPRLQVIQGDIRDYHFCQNIVMDVDAICHLAALISIPFSYVSPSLFIDVNVTGTYNICQAAVHGKVKKIIVTSTSEVYGTAQYVPIDEKHPRQPQSPYSASKISSDAIAMSFYHSYELPVTIIRPFNTFGPRQSARAIIPTIITQLLSNQSVVNIGDLRPLRDFIYVKDTCRAYITLLQHDQVIGEDFNVCTGKEISINDLVKFIMDTLNIYKPIEIEEQRVRPISSEVMRLCGDYTKIKNATGFEPEYDLKTGLQEVIDWFLQPGILDKYKIHLYNI